MRKKLIGTSFLRVEGHDKITGTAKYIDDLYLPGMIYGATIRSKIPRGKITCILFEKNIPWNEFVIVTSEDIPGKNHIAHVMNDQPCLAEEYINHFDEPVVLIAHKDKYLLEKAREHIKIETSNMNPVLTIEESLSKEEIIYGKDNIFKSCNIESGNVDSAIKKAYKIVEREYFTGAQEHMYLETNGMLATYDRDAGVTVRGTMQCPYFVKHALIDVFELHEDKIRVIQTETGGAFGGKEDFSSMIASHAALLAFKSGRPVKLVYDRAEDMSATTRRHPSRSVYKTALDENGKLLAMDIDFVLDGGAYSTMSPVVLARGAIHAGGVYECPNIRIRAKAVATNYPPHGAFRGFGVPQSIFALEKHIDDIAVETGFTPDELRRKNFIKKGGKTATGQIIRDDVDLEKLLDRALRLSDYHRKIKKFKKQNASGTTKKGIGFSVFLHGAGFTGAGEKMLASVVSVEATREGKIRILASSTEMGQGKNTALTQIAADSLNISPELIEVVYPDTTIVPDSGPTVASRTTMIVGKLVEEACCGINKTLVERGFLKNDYSSEDFQKACINYVEKNGKLKTSSRYSQPPHIKWDEETFRGDAYATFAWAVYVAEVSVDIITYETKVDDFLALQEVGRVVNPTLAKGQIQGGVAQGIGFTLYENVIWNSGRMLNNTMNSYIIPGPFDLPDIKVAFEERPYEGGPGGAKGLGELPMNGPAPAILNAIENATGISFNHVPVLPEQMMEKLTLKTEQSGDR